MKRWCLVIFLWMIGLSAVCGQARMSLNNFRYYESDLTANQHGTEKRDLNGNRCALIKIATKHKGFQFDCGSSAVPTDVQYKTGEIWVYVSPGVKKLGIHHDNLGNIDYKFPIPIEPAQVYKVTLSPKNVTEIETADSVSVTLTVKDNSEIWLDGKRLGVGIWSGILQSGEYSVECRKENCYPSKTPISVYVAAGAKLTLELKPPIPIMSSLSVSTSPSGAQIWVDGVEKGTAPKTIPVSVGSHSVKLQCDRYDSKILTVYVEKGKTKYVNEKLSPFFNIEIEVGLQNHKHSRYWYSLKGKSVDADIWMDDVDDRHLITGSAKSYIPIKTRALYGPHMFAGRVNYDGRTFAGVESIDITQSDQKVDLLLTRRPLEYVKPNMFYWDLMGYVPLMRPWGGGIGESMGGYIKRVNIEASIGFSGISALWDDSRNEYGDEDDNNMAWFLNVMLKTGYGIRLGPTVGLTPQVGLGWALLDVYGQSLSLETSLRLSIGVCRYLSLFVIPEYGFTFYTYDHDETIYPFPHRFGLKFGLAFNFHMIRL